MGQEDAFDGAKLALFIGAKLVVILRDDIPGLPFAGYWDLPGGGREGAETPLGCALRECREELGLQVPETAVIWRQAFHEDRQVKWFFVAEQPAAVAGDIVFGDEGQRWTLMTPEEFLAHPKAVPAFQARLRLFLGRNRSEKA
ncbi:DNA mismatch repair protein MutT [Sulfitobacter alexandrii]|uniref:DNA mismatch repair protein MutT n=1 Tax=Sulfitobacter alexandrii TaxID=1917485 RepID=A0A1J0WKR2_9RHOB|nr:NUDIX hydrolase [Sulfitobacter alexandrii]APE44766.1 DNA mismatch repair protein MutT [Sulfitobacter alexandrii]